MVGLFAVLLLVMNAPYITILKIQESVIQLIKGNLFSGDGPGGAQQVRHEGKNFL